MVRHARLPIPCAQASHAQVLRRCVEMRDCEHPPEGRCSPQALLQQVIDRAEEHGVPLAGENALQRCVGLWFACGHIVCACWSERGLYLVG